MDLLTDSPDLPRVVIHEPAVAPPAPPPEITTAEADALRRLLAERARRSVEALRLYEPLPVQDAFHRSPAPERILRGSNRGGKTLPAAVEVARAVTGQDPFGKWPARDGRFFLVGKDGRHLAQVMWDKLHRARAFKMLRDKETGLWRSYRPWDPLDEARVGEARWAPPLIPPRLIAEVAWENKKESLPKVVRLVNGWEMYFFSSLGKPPQGADIDGAWFDEEIIDPAWYPEVSARLLDRKGKFLWSATPQAGTEQLWQLHERAEELQHETDPPVTEHVILLKDNPHIGAAEKRAFAAKLDPDEAEVRIGGNFALLGRKVYPEYDPFTHGVPYRDIPPHWTRYAVIDPGHQVCAVLFAAVPPPGEGDHVYLYDELYLRHCDAERFGKEMAQKAQGQCFQSFIIDHQGARVHDTGSGRSVEEQYADALKKYKVSSVATGANFVWGSNDVKAGVEAFRAWLRIREDGTTKVRVVRDAMIHLDKELKVYRKKVVKGEILDEPDPRGKNHLVHCTRYLAMYNPRYVKPPAGKTPAGAALAALRAKRQRRKDKRGGSGVTLGPVERT